MIVQKKTTMGGVDADTEVLMWDGGTKKARDIVVGDRLVGDDGKDRFVLGVSIGNDDFMQKISTNHGLGYNASSSHIMTMKQYQHRHMYLNKDDDTWRASFYDPTLMRVRNIFLRGGSKENQRVLQNYMDSSSTEEDIFDVGIQDFLQMNRTTQNRSRLVLNHCCIAWKFVPTIQDPYDAGRRLDLDPNLLFNSMRVRLEFMAGVADQLGSILRHDTSKPIIIIRLLFPQKDDDADAKMKRFCNMIHSLGFVPTLIHQTIFVSGNQLWRIPLRRLPLIPFYKDDTELPSYCAHPTLKSIGPGRYCSFRLDGNGRFLMANFLVVHA